MTAPKMPEPELWGANAEHPDERFPDGYWVFTKAAEGRAPLPTDVPAAMYARLTGVARAEQNGEEYRQYPTRDAAANDLVLAALCLLPPDTSAGRETQESIGRWIAETFPGADPTTPRKALRVLEELVELCLVSGASGQDLLKATFSALSRCGVDKSSAAWIARDRRPDKIPAEAADVEIVLRGLAQLHGFDLQAEVDKKMAINRARRWKANGDGTGYHVKEEPWTPKPPPEAPAPSP